MGKRCVLSPKWRKNGSFSLRGRLVGIYPTMPDLLKEYARIGRPNGARVYAAAETALDHENDNRVYCLLLPPLDGTGIPKHYYSAASVQTLRNTVTHPKPPSQKLPPSTICPQKLQRLPPQSGTTRLNRI